MMQPLKNDGAEFWRGRRVLLTGHTGFKGAWLALMLREWGAEVTGYALGPYGTPTLWELLKLDMPSVLADLRDAARIGRVVAEVRPQIVLHLAAQALVRESYRDPLATFETNVMGTANLLQACRGIGALQGVVVVTSDKVYKNDDAGRPFVESDRLGGHDPYSNSKACAELLTASFRDSFFSDGPPIATARAGNVIGGGDWSADRLIPDCVRALDAGAPVLLRYPQATRPWQHVLDPLAGYLSLAQALVESPESAPRTLNFGPDPQSFCSVSAVVEAFSARFAGKPGWRPDGSTHPVEAQALTLSSLQAQRSLGWQPKLNIAESLSWTADWYRAFAEGKDMPVVTRAQIAQYHTR